MGEDKTNQRSLLKNVSLEKVSLQRHFLKNLSLQRHFLKNFAPILKNVSFDQYSYKCEFISNNEAEIAPKKCVVGESVVVMTLSQEYVVATTVSLFQRQILETLSLDMTNVRFSRKCLCNVTFSNNTFFRRDL